MKGKLWKKIAVCVMTAALCAGAYAPVTADAAEVSNESLAGRWYCRAYDGMSWGGTTSDGIWTFNEDGSSTDMWGDAKQNHIESGTLGVYVDDTEYTFGYDFWVTVPGVGSLEGAKSVNGTCLFQMGGSDSMSYWNIGWDSDNSRWKRYGYGVWKRVKEGGESSGSGDDESREDKEAEEKRKALELARREAERLEKEAAEQGFVNAAQLQEAKAAGKTSGEYYNNAVVNTPGIENAVSVGQGGQLVIDGQVTNATATIEKVSSNYVDSIRAAREGQLLNVVKVSYPAGEALVTFYMPGVQTGDNIVAAQYADGTWTDVEVVEVRTDHVTLKLKGSGVVAFLKK